MFRALLIVSLLIANLSVSATDRTYLSFGVSTELADRWTFTLAPEWRSDPDNGENQYHADLSVQYELLENWDVEAGYRYGEIQFDDAESVRFERFNLDTQYALKFHDFRLQFRLRYTNENIESDVGKEYLRYRVKLAYDWDRLHLKPYLSYELYDSLEAEVENNRNEYEGGVSWKIIKGHDLSLGYSWVDKLHSRKDYGIIKIAYDFSF